MSEAAASTWIAVRAGRRSPVLRLRADANRLWAGLFTATDNTGAIAFSGCDTKDGAHVLGGSLIIGAHYPMSRKQLVKAVRWLRAQGVNVDFDDEDAAVLSITDEAQS
ncbi:hypothetical protein EA661_12880 [Pseudoxanthomonas winnipegensis]|uniref:Uncharacterized protein n=1 Tax=Pseudoxanthomonas winnipegensis TaxID=2480810 RepID=A0A4Q8LEL6_9GAMM|nr:hypothetical protein [Pseudoxanthomonas winnipegensis]TAA27645.1 hypothetical protein EA661_12880 [Pseudoxanthomonas winnipegensis]